MSLFILCKAAANIFLFFSISIIIITWNNNGFDLKIAQYINASLQFAIKTAQNNNIQP